MGYCSCGPRSSKKEEIKDQYKCQNCGKISNEEKECCGASMEKLCHCGSGKYAKECCQA